MVKPTVVEAVKDGLIVWQWSKKERKYVSMYLTYEEIRLWLRAEKVWTMNRPELVH